MTLAILLCALAGAVSGVESRITELQLAAQERFAAKDWEGAEQLVRQITAIDPDHPKAYLLVVLMQQRRAAPVDTVAEMDRLQLSSEKGRIYAQGVLAVMDKRLEEARRLLGSALEAYQKTSHGAGQAACHTALGNLERRLENIDAARLEYEAARARLVVIGDRLGLADVLSSIAKIERDRGRPTEAAARQKEILEIRRALGDEDGQGRSLHEIGLCLIEAGDPAGASEALREALDLRRRRSDRPGQITTLRVIAQADAAAGDVTAALGVLEEARAMAAALPDPKQEAEIVRLSGEISLVAGRHEEARIACERGAEMFGALKDASQSATSAVCAAAAMNRLGQFRKAGARLEEIRAAAAARSDKTSEASALTEISAGALATGDILKALDSAERALALHVELKNLTGQRADQNKLGVAHYLLGDPDRAMRAVEEGLSLAEASGDVVDQAAAHINLGVLLADRGETKAALRHLEATEPMTASTTGRRLRAAAWGLIAEIQARTGRVEDAARRFEEALRLLGEEGDAVTRVHLLDQKSGLLRLLGRWAAAQQSYAQSLELAKRFGLREEEWRARWGLAACAGALGRTDEGIAQGLASLDGIERARTRLGTGTLRMRYLADRVGPHETLLELLLRDTEHAKKASGATAARDARGAGAGSDPTATRAEGVRTPVPSDRIALAFQVAERSRARGLLDQIAEREARRRARIDTSLIQAEADALDRIGGAMVRLASGSDGVDRPAEQRRIDEGEDELRRVQVRIQTGLGDVAAAPAPATLAQVQEVLHRDEALLAYFLGERSGWLWTVTRDRARVWPVPAAPALAKDVAAWREALAGPGGAFDRKAETIGAALARKILPAGSVPDQARLLIVPDGPLHDVPFDALPAGRRTLVEEHETVVLPSASVLRALRRGRRPTQASGFLGVGPPRAAKVDQLPAAEREVTRIAQLFPEAQRTLLTEGRASRTALDALDLSRFRFIHIATHGWMDPSDPRLSGLRLGRGGDAGSLLSVPEIQRMPVSADVVVLSACETAGGELLRGEGVAGLAHAFLRAGAASVVVSLWDVNDEASADFMESFYKEVQAGRPAAAALRSAKLAFKKSDRPARRAPLRWAPFVLVGEPEAGTR